MKQITDGGHTDQELLSRNIGLTGAELSTLVLRLTAVLPILGFALLLNVLAATETFDSPALMLLFSATMFVIAGGIAFVRYREWGLGDPLLLYSLVFAVYNASVLAEMAIGGLYGNTVFYFFGDFYIVGDFVKAGIASNLAMSGLLLAVVLLMQPQRRFATVRGDRAVGSAHVAGRLFAVGLATLIGSMALTTIIVIQTVGIVAFLSTARTGSERINPSTVLGIGIPLPSFAIAAIACMLVPLFAYPSRRRTLTFLIAAAVFILFNFVQGNRHLIIYMAIMTLGAYATFIPQAKRSIVRLSLLAASTYLVFALVSAIRAVFPLLFSGSANIEDLTITLMNFSWTWILPSRNEFAGPYLTLIETVAYPAKPVWGTTYVASLLSILPSRLYPGEKTLGLAAQFTKDIGERVTPLAGVGFGFSPVAEALLNFGWLFVPLIFMVLAFALHYLSTVRSKKLVGLLIYLVVLAQVVNLNRYSLDGVLQEAVFSTLIVAILALIAVRKR